MSDTTTSTGIGSITRSARGLRVFAALFFGALAVVGAVGCAAEVDENGNPIDDDSADELDESQVGETSDELKTAGPCAGTAIDRAVKCAQAKGARVLSYYRSPAEQERVRRENGCTNRCTGMAGCVRPTAGCNSSPHTRCRAVDLVADGAPVSRSALRACGLAKTSLPHANHYDLVN
jgi:uncharacterized protein YcbK (DUF882 family)